MLNEKQYNELLNEIKEIPVNSNTRNISFFHDSDNLHMSFDYNVVCGFGNEFITMYVDESITILSKDQVNNIIKTLDDKVEQIHTFRKEDECMLSIGEVGF